MPATIVHLVRHGEVSNPDGILYGRLPGFHLSEEGRLMAKAAAGFLAGRDVAVLVTSPLERAQETAAPLAAQFGLAPQLDDRLIEPWNHFEGTRFGVGDGALRRPLRRAGKRCVSATSCRSGSSGGRWRAGPSGTTRATAPARWPV